MPSHTLEETPLLKAYSSAPCPTHDVVAHIPCPVHEPSRRVLTSSSNPPTKSISETTPLLQAGSSTAPPSYDDTTPSCPVHAASSVHSPPSPRKWWKIIFLALLSTSVVAILSLRLLAPSAAAQYVREAAIVDVSNLSVESFTDRGVRARIRATVTIDASRVESRAIRAFGVMGTWLTRKISTEESKVYIYLPEYGEAVLGTATAGATVLDIQNGHITTIDFVSEVETGSLDILQSVANDYLNGGLGLVRVRGEADIAFKSGLLSVGAHRISEEMTFEGSKYKSTPVAEKQTDLLFVPEIPSLPNFQVNGLNFGEITLPEYQALTVNASITIQNPFPLDLEVSPLSFTVLLPGCETDDLVVVATAQTSRLVVKPATNIDLDISALIRNLPDTFIATCPKSHTSPMDNFLASYLRGSSNIIYVRGSASSKSDAPAWLLEFLRSLTIPVPFPGHKLGTVIESLDLSNVQFRLPEPDSKPGSPESAPRLNASVRAVVRLPEEISFPVGVQRLRSIVDVSYRGKMFGTLNLHKWIPATSSKVDGQKQLQVNAVVNNAPLDVTDYDVFEEVVRKFVLGGQPIPLNIDGNVDIDIKTNVGEFVISRIPAAGTIILDSFPAPGSLPLPKVSELVITDTTLHTITSRIKLSINNPTPWRAVIPYLNVNITHENMVLGNATVTDLHILPGNNTVNVWAVWDPRTHGGDEAERIGAQFLGEYVSGKNF